MYRYRLTKKLKGIAARVGGYHVARSLTSRLPRIFMYHRFSARPHRRRMHTDLFEQQIRSITKYFRVLSMGDLVHEVRTTGVVPKGVAVITVDDGHQDFYELAYPILKKHGAPATLYVTSRFVDGEIWLWPDRLEHALFSTALSQVELPSLGEVSLATESDRWRAWQSASDLCVSVPNEERLVIIEESIAACRVPLEHRPPPEFSAISWDEAREMVRSGMEIGAHTRNHPILSKLPEGELDAEICGSKVDIERRVGARVRSFCYPNGTPNDYNAATKTKVRLAGYDSAVAAWFGDDRWSDLFEIKRLPASTDAEDFNNKLAGVDQLAARVKTWVAR